MEPPAVRANQENQKYSTRHFPHGAFPGFGTAEFSNQVTEPTGWYGSQPAVHSTPGRTTGNGQKQWDGLLLTLRHHNVPDWI
jgi:hypothetical protein